MKTYICMKTAIHLHEDSYTFTWKHLYICMKTPIHLHEDSCTFTWKHLYICMKTAIHLHEDTCTLAWRQLYIYTKTASYTFTWRKLYICMKTAILLYEDSYTFTWRQLYFCMKKAIHLHEDVKTTVHLHEDYTFMIISCSFLPRIRNVLDKWCRENQNPHFVFSNCFSENLAVYENVENYGRARQATEDNIIRRKRVPKATNTHSGICSTHSFSNATMVARTRLIVML